MLFTGSIKMFFVIFEVQHKLNKNIWIKPRGLSLIDRLFWHKQSKRSNYNVSSKVHALWPNIHVQLTQTDIKLYKTTKNVQALSTSFALWILGHFQSRLVLSTAARLKKFRPI
jgi:hypothetical protein